MARRILVPLPSSFFFICLVNVHVMHPYNRIDTTAALKKSRFILLDRFDLINRPLIAVHAFVSRILILFFNR